MLTIFNYIEVVDPSNSSPRITATGTAFHPNSLLGDSSHCSASTFFALRDHDRGLLVVSMISTVSTSISSDRKGSGTDRSISLVLSRAVHHMLDIFFFFLPQDYFLPQEHKMMNLL